MEVKLQKWGNSLGIRIPKSILSSLKMKENDRLTLEEVEKKLVIAKSEKNSISLKKLFEEYDGENETKEFSWDEARGREIW